MYAIINKDKVGNSLVLPDGTELNYRNRILLKNYDKLKSNPDFITLVRIGSVILHKEPEPEKSKKTTQVSPEPVYISEPPKETPPVREWEKPHPYQHQDNPNPTGKRKRRKKRGN